ncbi:MAG TPA: SMC family ATPase [Candidatus Baltobacteraceae bacterium]|nr:SMC family ATPase [Candidatus Baltobacteraceae bacterium]
MKLRLENFRSFKAAREFDFSGLDIFAIIGDTGVGKTSLLEAITYALFNRSTWHGGAVKELIARKTSAMSVRFTFLIDGDEFTVTRVTRKNSSDHRLECPARRIDVSNEALVNKAICDALHMDADVFLHTVLLPQGKHAELLTASSARQDEILSELFRLTDLAKVAERARRQELRASAMLGAIREQRKGCGENPAEAVKIVEQSLKELAKSHARASEAVKKVTKIDGELSSCKDESAKRRQTIEALAPAETILVELHKIDQIAAEHEPIMGGQRKKHDAAKQAKADAEAEATKLRAAGRDAETLRTVQRSLEDLSRELTLRAQEAKKEAHCGNQCETEEKNLTAVRAKVEAAGTERKTTIEAISAVEVGCNEQEDLREKLTGAMSTRNAAQHSRDACAQTLTERNDALHGLTKDIDKANAKAAEAKAAYEAAYAEVQRVSIENQAAAIAEHLHAGDDCPVCHRALPKDFKAPKSTDVEKARGNESAAKTVFNREQRIAHELAGALTPMRAQIAEAGKALRKADSTAKAAEKVLVGLLPNPNEKLEKVLSRYDKAIEGHQDKLRSLRENLTQKEGAIATLGREEAAILERVSGLREQRDGYHRSYDEHNSACKRLAASLPKAFRAKEEETSAVATLSTVREAIVAATAVEARINAATNEFGVTSQELRASEDMLRRLVGEPRIRFFQALGTVAKAAKCSALPKDEAKCGEWAEGVVRTALGETTRLRGEIVANDERTTDLAASRDATVAEIGGEPHAVAQRLAVEVQRAEHGVETARHNAQLAKGLDEKVQKLEAIYLGVLAVKDAMHARRFKAYASKQRQHRLLQEASQILLEITKRHFGFTEDLEIFDYESNESGSVRSLSGGEKFMASMALSLAAVEIASSSGSKIDCLFLDEGFDGLDNTDALELAMLELRKWARAGRMIGVITHVHEVTKFVNDTIMVTKTADGSDFIRVGAVADEEEEAAVEGLVSHLAGDATAV